MKKWLSDVNSVIISGCVTIIFQVINNNLKYIFPIKELSLRLISKKWLP